MDGFSLLSFFNFLHSGSRAAKIAQGKMFSRLIENCGEGGLKNFLI